MKYQQNVGFIWLIIKRKNEMNKARNTARLGFICIFESIRRKGLPRQTIGDLEQELINKHDCDILELNACSSN